MAEYCQTYIDTAFIPQQPPPSKQTNTKPALLCHWYYYSVPLVLPTTLLWFTGRRILYICFLIVFHSGQQCLHLLCIQWSSWSRLSCWPPSGSNVICDLVRPPLLSGFAASLLRAPWWRGYGSYRAAYLCQVLFSSCWEEFLPIVLLRHYLSRSLLDDDLSTLA